VYIPLFISACFLNLSKAVMMPTIRFQLIHPCEVESHPCEVERELLLTQIDSNIQMQICGHSVPDGEKNKPSFQGKLVALCTVGGV